MLNKMTPESLTQEIRQRIQNESFETQDMELPARPACPTELAKRITVHNEAVAALLARQTKLHTGMIALPDAMVNDTPAASVATNAGKLREEWFDLLRAELDQLTATGKLRGELLGAMVSEITQAQSDLDKARSKATTALGKAGITLEATHGYAANPPAAKIQFSHLVDTTEGVVAAQRSLNLVKTARNALAGSADMTKAAHERLQEALCAAYMALT